VCRGGRKALGPWMFGLLGLFDRASWSFIGLGVIVIKMRVPRVCRSYGAHIMKISLRYSSIRLIYYSVLNQSPSDLS